MGISTVAWHCFGSLRAPFEEYQRVTDFISEKQNADGVYGNEKTAKAVLTGCGKRGWPVISIHENMHCSNVIACRASLEVREFARIAFVSGFFRSLLMLMAGGSLVAGSDNPHFGTLMPLGPSTPSVCSHE